MKLDKKLVLAANETRSKSLFEVLKTKVDVVKIIEFDPVPLFYKYFAAAVSYSINRRVWWNRYQWHPLSQKGRAKRLIEGMETLRDDIDALLIGGSWFRPILKGVYSGVPYYMYIDQSVAREPDEGDVVGEKLKLQKSRIKFNQEQLKAYKNAVGILCTSNWAKDQTLKSHEIDEKKVHHVGWGPCSINMLDEDIKVDYENLSVLFVGNDFYRKGVDILRKAIPLVVEKVPKVKFIIIGKNFEKVKVEPHPNMIIVGSLYNAEIMREYFRNATVFVLPHRFDRSPRVLAEAMSAGKPIVASRQGGVVDAVKHEKTGFLIEVGDVEALAKYLVELLKNKDLCLKFGIAGRRLMNCEFTFEVVADRILTIIGKDLNW